MRWVCIVTGGVGVMKGDQIIHMAPPANRVRFLMEDLLQWLKQSRDHPLIKSCVFHYEFEFIHPFSDGNGRMGRLWQSLILAQWQPLFANLPVESLIHQNQDEYYAAINQSTQATDSARFIEFMLRIILDVLTEDAETSDAQSTPQVTPQILELLRVLDGEMLRGEIQEKLGLKDRKSFSNRYLKPALEAGLIEMTIPDKPTSRLQRYRLVGKLKNT